MQINQTAFTDREAMILRESLGAPLEKLSYNQGEALSTGYLAQNRVTRDEFLQTLTKFWQALPNDYEKVDRR